MEKKIQAPVSIVTEKGRIILTMGVVKTSYTWIVIHQLAPFSYTVFPLFSYEQTIAGKILPKQLWWLQQMISNFHCEMVERNIAECGRVSASSRITSLLIANDNFLFFKAYGELLSILNLYGRISRAEEGFVYPMAISAVQDRFLHFLCFVHSFKRLFRLMAGLDFTLQGEVSRFVKDINSSN